jgi:hypothetical protein
MTKFTSINLKIVQRVSQKEERKERENKRIVSAPEE